MLDWWAGSSAKSHEGVVRSTLAVTRGDSAASAPNGCGVCARLPTVAIEDKPYPPPAAEDEWLASDRIRGAMIGAAIGDGVGSTVHAGQDVPSAPTPGSIRTGEATQLSLFTAEGLIRMYVRAEEKGIGPSWQVIRHALERWNFTQGEPPTHAFPTWDQTDWPDGWLVRQHALHHRVDGFSTTRTVLQSTADSAGALVGGDVAVSQVKGSDTANALACGAPCGLTFGAEDALRVGATVAGYTHGGTAGHLAPAALARIIAGLVRGDESGVAIDQTKEELQAWPRHEIIAPALDGGSAAAHNQPTAVAALQVGLNTLRRKEIGVIDGIRMAVTDGGTAAGVVAGALLGADRGATGIDPCWRVAPTTIAVVEAIADAMSVAYRCFTMRRRLPGWDREQTWQAHGSAPGVAILWPRFPGW